MTASRPWSVGLQVADREAVRDPVRLGEVVRAAVAAGVDDVWFADHIGSVDPFPLCVAAAAASERVRVGTLVLNNELHHPAVLARTAATVDRMTGGRFILGCGTGYAESEHTATGIELRPPGARVTRFGECMTALRSLLDTGAVDLDGEHHRLHISDLGVRPVHERLPILIGGHGRRVVEVAGRVADIFQYTGITHGDDGAPRAGGFGLEDLRPRARWLADAAATATARSCARRWCSCSWSTRTGRSPPRPSSGPRRRWRSAGPSCASPRSSSSGARCRSPTS